MFKVVASLLLGLCLVMSVGAGYSSVPDQQQGYPIRANVWTGCSHWTHMDQGEHRGKFDREWLKGLTWNELQSLHADDHEGRVKWQFAHRPFRGVQVVSLQDCPNGQCPIQRGRPTTPSVAQDANLGGNRGIVRERFPRVYGVRGAFIRVAAARPLRRILTLPFRSFRAVRGR